MRESARTKTLWQCGAIAAPLAALLLLGIACKRDPTGPGKGKVAERWFHAQPNGGAYARPAVSDSVAYFASGGGVVIARARSSGVVKWSTQVGVSPHAASPEIGGSDLLLRDGILVVPVAFHTSGVDVTTGTERWRYHAPLDTIDNASPRPGFLARARIAADENTVYIPAWGATVSAVDIKTGQARWVWRVDPTLPYRSGAAGLRLSGDTMFATVWHFIDRLGGKSEAWLLALDKRTGAELWRVVLPRQSSGTMIKAAPAVWRNLVYVNIGSGDLYAFDRNTRHLVWHIPTQLPAYGMGAALLTGPEVDGDVVYSAGSDMKIHAYDAGTGRMLWETEDIGQIHNDLLITDKYVYVSAQVEFFIRDRKTGARYTALRHPRRNIYYSFSPPASYNGQLFVTLSDGAWSFDEP